MGHFMTASPTASEIVSRHQTMFQQQAQLLGISTAAIKEGWAQGKSLQQLAKENKVTQEQIKARMQAAQTAALTTQLQALVSGGVITQTQADARLKVAQAKGNEKGSMRGHRGMGWHRGFGV